MSTEADNPLVEALDRRRQDYCSNYRACGRDLSETAVHDLRVSARRLLAALDITRTLDSHPRVRKARRFLKKLLDTLDNLRDVQVMLVRISEVPEHQPDLRPFQSFVQSREKRLLRGSRRQIQDSKPSDLDKWIDKSQVWLVQQAQIEGYSARLLRAVDGLYTRAARLSSQMEAAQPASIHKARIAFKRFRYAAEIIQPLLPAYPENHFKRMHDYQSLMGDIRDLEILRGGLAAFAERLAQSVDGELAAVELAAICHSYEACQAELTTTLLKDRAKLGQFWRSAPNQPFPWENNHDPLHHSPRNRIADGRPGRRAGRQPAPTDRQGSEEDAADRAGIEAAEGTDRRDHDQSLPSGDTNRRDPGQEV